MLCRILIADDEPGLRDLFRNAILQVEPLWTVETVRDGREAMDLLCQGHFDVAVLDVQMPYLDGLEVLQEIRREHVQTDVILMTRHGDVEMAVQVMKEGSRDFIQKPINFPNFIATIRTLLETRHHPPHIVATRLDAFLKEHASRPSLKLSDLCEHFHLSRSHVARLFRENFNISFERRLSFHRVYQAKHLMETTDDPLYGIAEQFGSRYVRRIAMRSIYAQGQVGYYHSLPLFLCRLCNGVGLSRIFVSEG